MDQYANDMKHMPMTINWAANEIDLPVDDELWFQGRPSPSCPLALDFASRSKALHATGNRSSKAWYIVFASLWQEARQIAYPKKDGFLSLRSRITEPLDGIVTLNTSGITASTSGVAFQWKS